MTRLGKKRRERLDALNSIPPEAENQALRAWGKGEKGKVVEQLTGLTHRQLALIRWAWAGGA